ncbi:MAG: serine--tRNA ligase [Dehalococcoidia bacterium]
MLTAQYIRENLDRVRADVERRQATAPLDDILRLDEARRALLPAVEGMRAERNAVSKAIGQAADPEAREAQIAAMRELGDRLEGEEQRLRAVEAELHEKLLEVPNVLDPSVPTGVDESENVVLETVGDKPQFSFTPRPHWELGEMLGGIDFERGVKMSGSRFFVLRGALARLHRALIQFFLDEHVRAGFTECYLPDMLTEASLYAAGQLPKFRDNLYRDAEEDYFFSPTAEVPFVNLYRDEIIPAAELPMRLVAHTPCFRREKMSAGRDVRGIKRVHQFEKVEMFVYAEPEESEREFDLLVARARALPELLGIPYRVVQLCSGDTGFNATKTWDIELWAPGQDEWTEVSSVSNCLDFQAWRANIRYRSTPESPTRHPHLLNGSGLPPGRVMVALIENYQREDGSIEVPEVLRPYVGTDRITRA